MILKKIKIKREECEVDTVFFLVVRKSNWEGCIISFFNKKEKK